MALATGVRINDGIAKVVGKLKRDTGLVELLLDGSAKRDEKIGAIFAVLNQKGLVHDRAKQIAVVMALNQEYNFTIVCPNIRLIQSSADPRVYSLGCLGLETTCSGIFNDTDLEGLHTCKSYKEYTEDESWKSQALKWYATIDENSSQVL